MSRDERLAAALGEALDRRASYRAALAERSGQPLRSGDLLVLPETSRLPIEWAVVERRSDDALQLVPADLFPLVGTADVAVSGLDDGSPLTLRCGHAVQVPADRLSRARRSGVLAEVSVIEARRRIRALRAGRPESTVAREDVDREPEYLDWASTVLEPARAALDSDQPTKAAPPRRFAEASSFRLAASWLLFGVLAAAGGGYHLDRLDRLRTEQVAAVARATENADELAARLAAAERRGNELAVELSARPLPVPGGESAGASPRTESMPSHQEPVLNPRIEWFQPASEAERGELRTVQLSAGASWICFILETFRPERPASYRVELLQGRALLWSGVGLERQGVSEVTFLLPTALFKLGEHRLRLLGETSGAPPVLLEEFSFKVETLSP